MRRGARGGRSPGSEPIELMPNNPTDSGNSEVAIVLLNEEGRIVDAQPNCTAALGWTREELVDQDVGMLLKTGRDLILEHLARSSDPDAESGGNTSLSIKVLAKRKDKTQFAARVSLRPFAQLNCWTAAFYSHVAALESEAPPTVSPQEIELATRAMQDRGSEIPKKESGMSSAGSRKTAMSGENALWRTARLLVRSRKDQHAPEPEPPHEETPEIEAMPEIEPPAPGNTAPGEPEQQPEALPEIVQAHEFSESLEISEPAAPVPSEAEIIPMEEPAEAEVREEFTAEILPSPEVLQEEPAEAPPRIEQEAPAPVLVENTAEIVRLRSELERERGLRTRAEQRAASLNTQLQALNVQLNETLAAESTNSTRIAELENQFEVSQQLLSQERAQLEKESMERGAAEEQMQMLKELNGQLEASMASFEESNRILQQEKDELQRELQGSRDALHESELGREGEMKKRQEMELRMTTAVREQQDAEAKARSEMAKAESALRASELQCKRLEADLLRARSQASEQERQASRKAEEFRSRLREPVHNLNQTAYHLLQSDLPEDQKQMMEIMLREVLAVENSLRERMAAANEQAN